MKNIELLAPAGSLEKLKVAENFGANAVYVGGKQFSLRSYAGNLDKDELYDAVKLMHSQNKKLYVTVNIFAKNNDFGQAEEFLKYLEFINVDGVIMTDPGLIALCKKKAPKLIVHLSTQANTLNKYAVKFWHEQGVSRVVLARELSLEEIFEIHQYNKEMELEAFVHGAMCISYSGRCLLSNYLTTRDANRGECVQVCRWKFKLSEVSRHNNRELLGEQDENGTYFMNSKDLNMIEGIKDLENAGICSFKIEGRMKSEFYLATVVNAYRRAIDEYEKSGTVKNIDLYNSELYKISNREYTKAFNYGKQDDTVLTNSELGKTTSDFIAYVLDSSDCWATVEMRNRFKSGEEMEVLSPGNNFLKKFQIEEILDSESRKVTDAKLVQHIYRVKTPFELQKGDFLRRNKEF